tara:strand:+ start:484 stop:1497 length:1014 start_codon:yes stop_codon:yes gene_type:complete
VSEEANVPDEEADSTSTNTPSDNFQFLEEVQNKGIKTIVQEQMETGQSERGEILPLPPEPYPWDEEDMAIDKMNLSNDFSKQIAMEIQSYEGKGGAYFRTIQSAIIDNQDTLNSSRMQSVSNLRAGEIVAGLLVEGERYATSTALQVSTCQSNESPLGHNMQCILTNKRMILIDSDDDVVNTITGSYKGTFPRSNNLDLVSQNYFSILFKPFRISDVTDISVNFRYGSETKRNMRRGWPSLALFGVFFLSAACFYLISPNLAFLAPIVPALMLAFPINNQTSFPVYVTKVRQLNVTVVNAHTKHVESLVLHISDNQSIESALEWTSVLQSLSSATTD